MPPKQRISHEPAADMATGDAGRPARLCRLRRQLEEGAEPAGGCVAGGRSVPGTDVQAVGFRDWCQEHSGVSEHVLAVLYRTTVYLAVW